MHPGCGARQSQQQAADELGRFEREAAEAAARRKIDTEELQRRHQAASEEVARLEAEHAALEKQQTGATLLRRGSRELQDLVQLQQAHSEEITRLQQAEGAERTRCQPSQPTPFGHN